MSDEQSKPVQPLWGGRRDSTQPTNGCARCQAVKDLLVTLDRASSGASCTDCHGFSEGTPAHHPIQEKKE
jgi:hypothetical protein